MHAKTSACTLCSRSSPCAQLTEPCWAWVANHYIFKVNNKDTRTTSMTSFCIFIVNLKRFHTLNWCFHCWLWRSKCWLFYNTTYIFVKFKFIMPCWESITQIIVQFAFTFRTSAIQMYLAGHQWVIWKCFLQRDEDFRVRMSVLQKVSKAVQFGV